MTNGDCQESGMLRNTMGAITTVIAMGGIAGAVSASTIFF